MMSYILDSDMSLEGAFGRHEVLAYDICISAYYTMLYCDAYIWVENAR